MLRSPASSTPIYSMGVFAMKKKLLAAVAAVLLVILPLLLTEPPDPYYRMTRRTENWQGVLTVWQIDGWYPAAGDLTAVLERAGQLLNKRHPGVVVDVRKANVADAGQGEAPDVISFPLGAFDTPSGILARVSQPVGLVPGLVESGKYGNDTFAVPWCRGGYALLANRDLLSQWGVSWQESWTMADLTAALEGAQERMQGKKNRSYGLIAGSAPERQPLTCWQNALAQPEALTGLLARGFADPDSGGLLPRAAFERFLEGNTAFMPAYHGEILRCQSRAEQGKGFAVDIALLPDQQAPCTDLVQLAGITGKGPEGRSALAREYLEILLSESVQSRIANLGIMPALPGLEQPEDLLQPLRQAMETGVIVPNTFQWHGRREALSQQWQ